MNQFVAQLYESVSEAYSRRRPILDEAYRSYGLGPNLVEHRPGNTAYINLSASAWLDLSLASWFSMVAYMLRLCCWYFPTGLLFEHCLV